MARVVHSHLTSCLWSINVDLLLCSARVLCYSCDTVTRTLTTWVRLSLQGSSSHVLLLLELGRNTGNLLLLKLYLIDNCRYEAKF